LSRFVFPIIKWKLTKQHTVTSSSTEAELIALSDAVKELTSWRCFFQSISLDLNDGPTIWCDNAQTICFLGEELPKLVTRLHRVDIY
jgi:hypothetical protein